MRRYEIHWSKRAREDYEALDRETRRRIDEALKKLVETARGEPVNLDIKALKGKYEGYYRWGCIKKLIRWIKTPPIWEKRMVMHTKKA